MKTKLKTVAVVFGAIIFTTLAVSATDIAQNVGGGLFGSVIESDAGPCPVGSTLLLYGGYSVCMDTYEASPSELCLTTTVKNELDTSQNINIPGCVPQSRPERDPWRFVSFTEAQQLCARAGKRLPTNEEWYRSVSGITQPNTCLIDNASEPALTGAANCVAPSGVHDLIGNVWEWVDETVTNGIYADRTMPESGYVDAVDATGVVTQTSQQPNKSFGNDYAWLNDEGVRGMLRGGFYGSGEDAGIFTLNASIPTEFRTTGIGFRCVKDIAQR